MNLRSLLLAFDREVYPSFSLLQYSISRAVARKRAGYIQITMGKPMPPKPSPGVYRDDPDRDDAASTSSAVLMDHIDYSDSDLPAYEDISIASRPTPAPNQEPQSYARSLTELCSYPILLLNLTIKLPHPSYTPGLTRFPGRN